MSSSAADIDNKEKDKTINKITSKDDKEKSTVLELLEEDDEFEVLIKLNYILLNDIDLSIIIMILYFYDIIIIILLFHFKNIYKQTI
jgi:hypothetical protein